MANEKTAKTVTTTMKVSNKKHKRSASFNYADANADEPGELVCHLTVGQADNGAMVPAVSANGYLTKENPRGLSDAEIDQLNAILDKLFAKAIADA